MCLQVILIGLAMSLSYSSAQPATGIPWNDLVKGSDVILTGSVLEGYQLVVPKDKMTGKASKRPDGVVIYEPVTPMRRAIGHITQVRVDDIFKQDGKMRSGTVINVFSLGLPPFYRTYGLHHGQRYLLFLAPLKADETAFTGTVLYQYLGPADKSEPFNPQSAYGIVTAPHGVVRLLLTNLNVIDEVRRLTAAK